MSIKSSARFDILVSLVQVVSNVACTHCFWNESDDGPRSAVVLPTVGDLPDNV